MSIVVDCGCCNWGSERSIDRLVERFRPKVLYGFDPYPEVHDSTYTLDGTTVIVRNAAAWTHDGTVPFVPDGTRSHVGVDLNGYGADVDRVDCFDLAAFLPLMPGSVILKLDVEGAEYTLIPHLVATGAIDKVELLLVEFHGDQARPPIPCPWETWE